MGEDIVLRTRLPRYSNPFIVSIIYSLTLDDFSIAFLFV